MPTSASARLMGVFSVLLAAALWGATGTMQSLLPEGRAPLAVGALRLAIGAATLLALAAPRAEDRAALTRIPRGPAFGAGAAIALYNLLFFAAVLRAGVGVGTAIAIGSAPIWVAAWDAARGRIPRGLRALGQTACIAGAAILALADGGGTDASDPLGGALLAAAAGLCYAVYSGFTGRIAAAAPPMALAALTFSAAALVAAPALLIFPLGWAAAPAAWGPLLFLGVFSTGVAYAFYTWGLGRVAVSTAVTLALAEPLTAWILALLVVGEALTPMRGIGALALFAGLALVTLAPAPRR